MKHINNQQEREQAYKDILQGIGAVMEENSENHLTPTKKGIKRRKCHSLSVQAQEITKTYENKFICICLKSNCGTTQPIYSSIHFRGLKKQRQFHKSDTTRNKGGFYT